MRVDGCIEFYERDALIAQVSSEMVPPVGAKISIRKEVWEVVCVTYALDYADDPHGKGMRANVDLKRVPKTQPKAVT